jgi:hypothetical protein
VPIVATFTLQNLHCNRESGPVGSSPYIWPVRLWLDDHTLGTQDPVHTIRMPTGHHRDVIKSGMRAGETAAIPFPFKTLTQRWEITTPLPRRALLLVVALFGAADTPERAIRRGSEAYASELDTQLTHNWAFLLDAITRGDIVSLNEIIKKIKDAVTARVKKAISDDLSGPEILADQDEPKGVDYYFSQISETPVRTPLSLSFSSDERVKIDPNYVGGTKWVPWASVAGGLAAPGSPVTVVPWGQWPFAVFVTGTDGGIYTTAGNPQTGFPGGWASVAGGQAAPGSPITVVPRGQKFALFVTGLDGVIYTTGGDPQTGFGSWASVPGIKAKPGSPVTAVAFGDGLALFVTDVDGGIYATSSRFPDYTIDGMFDVRVT